VGYLPVVPQKTVILDDRYELGPVLGNGGMARVHQGKDRQLKRAVAVKVLAPPFDQDKSFVERFRREAHAAARLNHPNIVAVYDSGSDDGTHYIVTELVEGETLADLLQREGALPPERVVEISRQICHALEAAHERGVVHRDVKPGNVMITPEGRVKVVDFGIARAAGAESVTRTGLVMGSASYLSPEQARGEPGDERSDIYSLGCVIYQMLTGRPPFVAENPISALYQHVNEPVDPPSSIRPVPPALEKAVLRALEKDPAKRFGSVKELEDALEASTESATMPLPVAAGEPTAPVERVDATAPIQRANVTAPVQRATPTGHRRARPFPWAVVGAVVLGLLVIAALAMALGASDPQQAARQAARDANQQQTEEPTDSPTESPTTVLEPPTVDDAYAALVAAIAQAEGAGQIDEKLAGELGDRADRAYEAYQAGDPEEVQKQLEEFGQKLAEATDKGEVPVEAADSIQSSFNDLVLAIQNDPVEVPPSGDEHSSDDNGHGHGNANGHDED
jgi:eukaryotic-like serine/threonine-protein kinase